MFLRNKCISYTRELIVVTFSLLSIVSLTLMSLALFTIFANNINVCQTLVMLHFLILSQNFFCGLSILLFSNETI